MANDASENRRHLRGLLKALARLGATVTSVVEEQMHGAVARYRMELRRVAWTLALSLAAVLLALASLAFLALTVMIAFWRTHPVAASASITVAFAALSLVAVVLVRGGTASAHDRHQLRPP